MGMNSLPNPRPTMAMFSFSRLTVLPSTKSHYLTSRARRSTARHGIPLFVRQSKGHILVSRFRPLLASSSACNHYILFSIYLVDGWSSDARGGKVCLPQSFSRQLIEFPCLPVPF